MTESIRFFQTLRKPLMDKIDNIVAQINETKSRPASQCNRQAVVRALVTFALGQDLRFKSGWGKYVSCSLKKAD